MPSSTPRRALPYPTANDSDDVPRDVKALAESIDRIFGAITATTTLTYTSGLLTGVVEKATGGATLATIALGYSSGLLSSVVEQRDGKTTTTTLTYTAGVLTSVTVT